MVKADETANLKEFARKIIMDHCWGLQIDEPDGASIQDLAEKLGLIESHIATEKDVDPEFDDYEIGDTIFKFTSILEDKDNG